MRKRLDNFFKISAHNSSIGTEFLAACSTFAAMAYIICVQPALLAGQLTGTETGMPFGALLTTTCLASAIGCFLMGLIANYPIGLAPGIGTNFFLVFSIFASCATITGAAPGSPLIWQTALAVIFLSGVLFLAISFTPLRKTIIDSLSPSLKSGIVAGLGLFIAYLGLKNGNIIGVSNNAPMLTASFSNPSTLTFFVGLIVTASLMRLKIKGAILYGIFSSGLIAYFSGILNSNGFIGAPADPSPLICKIDLGSFMAHALELLPLVFVCFFMNLFDTMGTVLGVAPNAGLLKNGKIDRIERVFAADAAATLSGSLLGHGTVTSFVESFAGTESGGRTGLTAIILGIFFLLALIFSPIISAVGACPPITASALVIVGVLMLSAAKDIMWNDITEALPAFLILAGIPFTSSIVGGIALGVTIYPIIKLCSGKIKEISWFTWITAAFLITYLILLGN